MGTLAWEFIGFLKLSIYLSIYLSAAATFKWSQIIEFGLDPKAYLFLSFVCSCCYSVPKAHAAAHSVLPLEMWGFDRVRRRSSSAASCE